MTQIVKQMKKIRVGLLPRIITAIVLGLLTGLVFPQWAVRISATFNGIFNNLLQFMIPLIIIGLVTPAIADIGKSAGRILLAAVLIAYADTVLSGCFSYATSVTVFPHLIDVGAGVGIAEISASVDPYFTIGIPPLMEVMTSLVFSFLLGLGIAFFGSVTLRKVASEFNDIVVKAIETVIIPLLPVYIYGVFLTMTYTGQVARVLVVFLAVIGVIFAMHVFLLVFQYVLAGIIAGKNPFRMLANMLPAYFTALGTSSSAATIPVTLEQTKKNGVSPEIAGFSIPLCATIHLSGSTLKIVACSVALMMMLGRPFDFSMYLGFIMMLGIMMVAAPGVPGGAIMAALGILGSMLGFGEQEQAIMIALYITMDNFGTACNVTGDGAIAVVLDRFFSKK